MSYYKVKGNIPLVLYFVLTLLYASNVILKIMRIMY